MTIDLMRFTSTVALVAAFAAAPALAQTMSDMDTNQDSAVSQDEFTTGYESSDAGSGWDADQSGSVSEQEFDTAKSAGGDSSAGDSWDNQDFAQWDKDQSGDLSQDEIAGAIFILYDTDKSGDLNEQEYQAYEQDSQSMQQTSN